MPDPEKPAENADENADETKYDLTVDGTVSQYTLAELQSMATKSAGADKRFEEAAAVRKAAGEAMSLRDSLSKASTDDDAYRTVCRAMGVGDDEIEEALKTGVGRVPEDDDDDDDDDAPQPAVLTQEQTDDIAAGKTAAMNAEREKIERTIRETLDKDKVLGDNVIKGEDARKALFDLVWSQVFMATATKGRYTPDLLTDAISTVRAQVEGLGATPTKKPKTDPVAELAKMGIGLGPSDSPVVRKLKETGEVDRVSTTDPHYADTLAARTLAKIARRNAEE